MQVSERVEKLRNTVRKSKKKEDGDARKGRKVAKHCVLPMIICGSGGSKSRLAKAAGAEPSGQMRDEKLHAVVAQSTFECKSAKTAGFGALLDVQMSFCVVGARDYAPCQKWDKTSGFCSRFKSVGRRGAFEEDLERCISRGTRGTRDMFMRDVRRPGHWFPERVCILEHQIFRFAKMILRDRCSTSLGSLFHGTRNTRWNGNRKNALVRGRQLGTQVSIFEGSLAELLRFQACS